MAYNKNAVLVGAATLFLDGANVGYTTGGMQIEHAGDFYDVEADQSANPIKTFRVKETFKIKTNLLESTLENIKAAWGFDNDIDASTPGYRKIGFGGSGVVAPIEHELDVYGNAPGTNRQRRIHFFKVVAVEFGVMTIEKNKEQSIPVTFQAYVDTDQPDGAQVGYFEDQIPVERKALVCRLTVA